MIERVDGANQTDQPRTDDERETRRGAWTGLLGAVEAWSGRGKTDRLSRWLARELDADGAPIRLAIADWAPALERIVRARSERPGWPTEIDDRLLAFFRMILRFTRPDGRPAAVGADQDQHQEDAATARERLARLGDAFLGSDAERVLGWWLPSRRVEPIPPPLPAWSSSDRALGVLRADWLPRGDFVVFDHREPAESSGFEVFGARRTWLADSWRAPTAASPGRTTSARPVSWTTTSSADAAEWTFHVGGLKITRTAVLLRGRKVAILADLVEGAKGTTPLEARWGLPPGTTVEPIAESRALLLRADKPGATAQAIPTALPSRPYETDQGRFSFDPDRRELVLGQIPSGSRAWLPLLISWDHARTRKRLKWRALTVSENYRACPPETAWAARVSWGRFETFVVYRSLGPPARRSFLGCTTTARLLVGRFTSDGDVDPIVALDDE